MSPHTYLTKASTSTNGKHTQTSSGTLAGAENILISGGTFITRQYGKSDDDKWMELLCSKTAAGAFHNSDDRRDPPKCHPHTRKAVIKDIMDWVTHTKRKEQFCWIYGPAGSGKSSIAQTIAELCEKQKRLASDFFFARTVPGRNTYTSLIPSLAYQLVLSIPDLRDYVLEAIITDGLIFTRSLPTQLECLILKPLARLDSSQHSGQIPGPARLYPNLVILDGLDECDGAESQSYILSSFSSALQKFAVPLIVLISSRPEHAIRVAFNGDLHERTRRLVLDENYHPNEDITLYLTSKFNEIKRVHPLASSIPAEWPAISDLERIVRNASGQFIYAATVVKFIKYHRDRPTKRLDIVLKICPPGNHTPFADLDALYRHILLSALDASMIETVLSLFAFLFTTAQMEIEEVDQWGIHTPEFIERFLGYESGELFLALADLHSIVDVPVLNLSEQGANNRHEDGMSTGSLRLYHASLGDFLLDKGRSGSLYIDMDVYHSKFTIRCFKHLTPWLHLKVPFPSPPDSRSHPSKLIRFGHLTFLQFLTAIDSPIQTLFDELYKFPMELFIGSTFQDECPTFFFLPTLFTWVKHKKPHLYGLYNNHYSSLLESRLSTIIDNHPKWQYILTGLVFTVDAAFPNQSRYGKWDNIYIPLSRYVPLSLMRHDSEECTLSDADLNRQHFSSHLKDILTLFDPQKELIGWEFLGIQQEPSRCNVRHYYSRMEHYIRIVQIATRGDDPKYCVDSRKVADFAMRLFDVLTWRSQPYLNVNMSYIAELFCYALQQIRGQLDMGKYLVDNQGYQVKVARESKKRVEFWIARYIEEYKQLSVSVPHPTKCTLRRPVSPLPPTTIKGRNKRRH